MNNPEKLVIMGTDKQTKAKTQYRKLKRWEIRTPPRYILLELYVTSILAPVYFKRSLIHLV